MQGSAAARGEKRKRCGATAGDGRAERRGGGQQRHEAETAGQRGTVNACGYVEKLERSSWLWMRVSRWNSGDEDEIRFFCFLFLFFLGFVCICI